MSERVRIVEVGPRDGLQNERATIPTETKVELLARLAATGLTDIEATSFVSPRWVPQLADAEQVAAALPARAGVRWIALVPNEQGYQRARRSGFDAVAVFTAASETFNRKNVNAGIDESLERFRPVLERARAEGVWVRGYVSTVLGCPYQGEVPLADVVRVARALDELGCAEISLGDTIGVGTPGRARAMLRAVAGEVPLERLAVHFHDTYGQALANVYACLEEGVRTVDSSVGGLGGCPYAAGASGNLATEDLLYMLEGLGRAPAVDLERLVGVARWISRVLGREPASRVARARRCPG